MKQTDTNIPIEVWQRLEHADDEALALWLRGNCHNVSEHKWKHFTRSGEDPVETHSYCKYCNAFQVLEFKLDRNGSKLERFRETVLDYEEYINYGNHRLPKEFVRAPYPSEVEEFMSAKIGESEEQV